MRGRFETSRAPEQACARPRRGLALWAVLGVIVLAALAFGVWRLTRPAAQPAAMEQPPAAQAPVEAPADMPDETPEVTPDEPPQPPAARELEAEIVEQTPPEPAERSLRLMAVGDNLIHNSVYWSAETADGGYDFTPFYQDIAPVIADYDLACIQQETIFANDPALYDNYPRFASPTAVGDALAQAGFNVVTMAGNHCYDKGWTGIADTASFWREQHPEVTLLGIHDSQADADTLRVVEKNGLRVALLDYTYGVNYEKPENDWTVDFLDRGKAARDIEAAKAQADFVIVFAHWGEEGEFEPNDYQRGWAEFFAAQNVDAVIGGHPHVLQPMEQLTRADGKQMPVFYSLGNFLSHQMGAEQMLGGLASLRLVKDDAGTRVEDAALQPTVTFISHRNTGWWSYRPMLLADYTAEMAAHHRIPEATPEYLWALYNKVTGK
mgnify:FL=1